MITTDQNCKFCLPPIYWVSRSIFKIPITSTGKWGFRPLLSNSNSQPSAILTFHIPSAAVWCLRLTAFRPQISIKFITGFPFDTLVTNHIEPKLSFMIGLTNWSSNRVPHTCLKINARKAFGDWISDKQSMKSLAVTGIIGEMQRKGATKHCSDRGFGFSRLNLQ